MANDRSETVEPHVVHKTVPIHEIHHKTPQHHSANALPAVSIEEFKKQGGSLKGREERHDFFPGEPKVRTTPSPSSFRHSETLNRLFLGSRERKAVLEVALGSMAKGRGEFNAEFHPSSLS